MIGCSGDGVVGWLVGWFVYVPVPGELKRITLIIHQTGRGSVVVT